MSDKLQKILAHAGYGSRREIETWITDGRITVNGKRAKLGDRADASDRVLVDGKMAYLTTQQKFACHSGWALGVGWTAGYQYQWFVALYQ